jgi:predicted cation transporter
MDTLLLVDLGLLILLGIVLAGPFCVRWIEKNLEIFLLLCGAAALTISGFAIIDGESFGWSTEVVREALTTPLLITTIFGIPIGIVQIVLIFGLLMYVFFRPVQEAIGWVVRSVPLHVIIFLTIVSLGLLSSIISAILAAIILVEVVCALPVCRGDKIVITVVSCFSIGLGAVLTPLGEPLSTIVISQLSGPPYYADFWYLIDMIGIYIVPGVLLFGLFGVALFQRSGLSTDDLTCRAERDSLRDVFVRAAKVYVFIAALIFLGEGFRPVILQYLVHVPSPVIFWMNSVSAVLDNATLAAAEINPALTEFQIKSALLALVTAGGMLIPGNIPNIISAGKIGISSSEWAKIGLPIGLVAMFVYFFVLFVPAFLPGI